MSYVVLHRGMSTWYTVHVGLHTTQASIVVGQFTNSTWFYKNQRALSDRPTDFSGSPLFKIQYDFHLWLSSSTAIYAYSDLVTLQSTASTDHNSSDLFAAQAGLSWRCLVVGRRRFGRLGLLRSDPDNFGRLRCRFLSTFVYCGRHSSPQLLQR